MSNPENINENKQAEDSATDSRNSKPIKTSAKFRTKIRYFYEQSRFFLIAILIALVVRTFLYEPFRIPSGSMFPTLLVGDYIFVSKFSYGYSRYSFPFSIASFSGRLLQSTPKRGDVAVFRNPVQPKIVYIKRIIGLSGDTIQVRGGRLYVNNLLIDRVRVENFRELKQYRQTLPSGKDFYILEESDEEIADNTRAYQVPAGHYFGMGDNRDNSQDSRYLSTVGYIPEENLIGRADLIWLSIDFSSLIWPLRIERLFTRIR